MWILNFLPDWIFHLVVLIGLGLVLVSFVFSTLPFIKNYRLPVLLVGLAISCIGFFFEGQLFNNASWEAKVKELEVKVAAAQAKSAKENVRIITKYKENTEQIKETTDENIQYIREYVSRDDNNVGLPNSVIVLHDSASQNVLPPGPGAAYEGTSDIKISQLTETVVDNYGTCYQIREQLKAFQEWYKVNKDIYNKAFE